MPPGPFNASSSRLNAVAKAVRPASVGAPARYYKGGEASVLPSDARLSFDGLVEYSWCIIQYITQHYHGSVSLTEWLLCGTRPRRFYIIIVYTTMCIILSIDSPNSGREYKYEKKSYETNHESVETTQLVR